MLTQTGPVSPFENCNFMLLLCISVFFPLFKKYFLQFSYGVFNVLSYSHIFFSFPSIPVCSSWHTNSPSPSPFCFFFFFCLCLLEQQAPAGRFYYLSFLHACLLLMMVFSHSHQVFFAEPSSSLYPSCPRVSPEFHPDFQLHLQRSGTFFPVGPLMQHLIHK